MTSYAFLTTKNFRIEASGKSVREAYKKAEKQWKPYIKLRNGRKV